METQKTNMPTYEIMVLIKYVLNPNLNTHAEIFSGERRILQECSCFIEFIKRVGEKR